MVVFLLLMVLLMLLLRNILKLYADQSSSALGARLRTRMVLGAALIALTPAVFMFLFSFLLMNRSIDRWFSPNTSELREDSTRVVLELAQYVTSNARGEAESIAAQGAPDRDAQALQDVLASHRITLRRRLCGDLRQGPAGAGQLSGAAGVEPGQPGSVAGRRGARSGDSAARAAVGDPAGGGAAQRRAGDQSGGPGVCGGHGGTASGKVVVAALPMPQGLSQTTARIRVRRGEPIGSCSARATGSAPFSS